MSYSARYLAFDLMLLNMASRELSRNIQLILVLLDISITIISFCH